MWFALASTYTHPGRDVHDFTRAIDRLCKAHADASRSACQAEECHGLIRGRIQAQVRFHLQHAQHAVAGLRAGALALTCGSLPPQRHAPHHVGRLPAEGWPRMRPDRLKDHCGPGPHEVYTERQERSAWLQARAGRPLGPPCETATHLRPPLLFLSTGPRWARIQVPVSEFGYHTFFLEKK